MDFLRSKLKYRKTKNRLGKAAAILLSSSFILIPALFGMSAATASAMAAEVPPIVSGVVQVSTPGQLEYIDSNQATYLNANIELMNNIALPTGYSWSPFGMSTPFSGTFNGQGYQITNVVSNIGGFFGTTSGTIKNVGVSATITNGSYSNNGILASVQNGGTIINSYATGSVSGSVGGNTGGLVGYQTAGSIIKCYSTASVSTGGYGNNTAGGLVGVSSGSISNSYATGSVSISGNPRNNGGLVGYLGGGTISNSYATGLVSGGSNGGLVGIFFAPSTISNSYFDTVTTGTSAGVGRVGSGTPSGVTGESIANMKSQSTFAGWDFTNTWGLSSAQNGGYPYLQIQTPTATVKYSTNSWTNQDVTATIVPSTAVSVTNNNGSLSHTFSENGSFTFNFVDEAGSKGSVTATVSNIDKTAPTTTDNAPTGWVNKDVTVALNATDDLSGVTATYYTIDGGVQQTGTSLTLFTEGVHTLTYWSTDKAGNAEAAHTATVKIDKTAPEAYLQFDPVSRDIQLFGRDALSGLANQGPIAPVSVTPIKGEDHGQQGDQEGTKKSDQKGDDNSSAETRTYLLKDLADNTLQLVVQVQKEGHDIKARVVSLQYNGGQVITPLQDVLSWNWAAAKDGSLKVLEQHMGLADGSIRSEVEAHYDARKNVTVIERSQPEGRSDDNKNQKDHDDGEHSGAVKQSGLVLLRLTSSQGHLMIEVPGL